MTQSLTDFFREKKLRSDEEVAAVDWSRRRMEWLDAINALYADIANWLALPIRSGTVVLQHQPRQISEEHLGTYTIDDLVLSVGDERVVFSPKGRNIIGSQGRVDVSGEAGEAMFVLQPGTRWCIVASRAPNLRLEALDENTFAETIQAVMRQ